MCSLFSDEHERDEEYEQVAECWEKESSAKCFDCVHINQGFVNPCYYKSSSSDNDVCRECLSSKIKSTLLLRIHQ